MLVIRLGINMGNVNKHFGFGANVIFSCLAQIMLTEKLCIESIGVFGNNIKHVAKTTVPRSFKLCEFCNVVISLRW